MGEYIQISTNSECFCLYLCARGTYLHAQKSLSFVCFRTEVEAYNTLDPGVRVVILKALCDIRVEVNIFFNFLFSLLIPSISCNSQMVLPITI